MNNYKKITIWENNSRSKLLQDFKDLVITYFNNLEYPRYGGGFEFTEKEEAKEARSKINKILDKTYSIMILAGVSLTVFQAPPPAIGGIACDIDILHNIFNLHRFQIPHEELLDHLERAIGIYKNDRNNAILRTINPFFWIASVIDYFVSLPFKLFGKVGFSQKNIEFSTVGKIIKYILYFVFYSILIIEPLINILEKFGYFPRILSFIQGLISVFK